MPLNSSYSTLFVDLFFAAVLCLALVFFWRKYRGAVSAAPAFWKHKASERWPWAPATCDDGRVKVWHGRRGAPDTYAVFVKFSYQVAEGTYRGWYWKKIGGITKDDADKLLDSLRCGPLYVRYLPSKPRVNVCDPFRDVRP